MSLKWFSVILVLLVSGCASLEKTLDVSKPEASVASVSIERLSMESITLLVEVEVENRNAFKLSAAGFDLDLMLNNSVLTSIAQPDTSLSIPAKGRNSVKLPVTLTFDQVLASIDGLDQKSEVAYGVKGNVIIDLPVIGDFKMPVDYSDVLPVPKPPEVAFENLSVDSVGFTGLKLSVDLGITNPNVFDVHLGDVNYQFKAEGKTIGQGNISSIDFPQGKTRSLSIPLSIGVSDVGTSLYRVLVGSDPIEVDVVMEANVDTDLEGWKSTPLKFETQQILNR